MKIPSAKTQVLTAAAVLLMLGGLTAAYAYTAQPSPGGSTANASGTVSVGDEPTSSTSSTSTASSTTSSTQSTSTASSTSSSGSQVVVCPPKPAAAAICRQHGEQFTVVLLPPGVQAANATAAAGRGVAHIDVQGDALYLSAEVVHLQPVTQYSVDLDVNGTETQLATLVTNQAGNGFVAAQLLLQDGHYAVSVQVYGASSSGTTALALTSASVSIVLPGVTPIPLVSSSSQASTDCDGGR